MVLLLVFGFAAGAATALSPCVLPVLPVALSAGVTGGRRRPVGVVVGLVGSFTFATVALVYLISALGIPDDLLRNLAIGVLAAFGLALVVPRAAARVEAWISRVVRQRPVAREGEGFWSGVLLGSSLGLVYAPCAGPILAGVITVSASQDLGADRAAIALSYAAGTGLVLYALMLGGRRVTSRWSGRSERIRVAMGVVMVAVAVTMAFELDLRFQTSIADNLPAAVVNPTRALEESDAAADRLAALRDEGEPRFAAERSTSGDLPVLGQAPEIRGTQRWFNTPDGRRLSLAGLRGRVVLIDFWTYSCINCIRTLPYLRAWDTRYRDAGLTIIGVHAPEFPFERDAGNVARAVRDNELRYPVAQDNDFVTWRAYGNRYWPAKYLIDARGRVRYAHFGEGEYGPTEDAIRALLAEAGRDRLGARVQARTDSALAHATPESYLGAERADRFVNGPLPVGAFPFRLPAGGPDAIPVHGLGLDGRWRVRRSHSVAAGERSFLHIRFVARRVFLVLGHRSDRGRADVSVDGRHTRTVRVREHRLYELVDLPRPGEHLLSLRLSRGTEAYAFTFG